MRKKAQEIAVMLYIAIAHPAISCLVWVLLSHVKQTASELSMIRGCLTLLQIFVMVISSVLVYWLIKRKQYLYPYQLKTMLAVSYIMFMLMIGFAANRIDYLSEEKFLGVPLMSYTLGVTAPLLALFLLAMIIERIQQEWDAKMKGLQSKDGKSVSISERQKVILTLCKVVIYPAVCCFIWVMLMRWRMLSSVIYWIMQILIMNISSVLVYYWETGKHNLSFSQVRKNLVCSNISFMVMLDIIFRIPIDLFPWTRTEGQVMFVAVIFQLTLIATGFLLFILFLVILIEYIIRKAAKSQVPEHEPFD